MDNLEYIPRDLVMTNGVPLGTAKNVVYRVVMSDISKTIRLSDRTTLKGIVRLENYEAKELGEKGYLLSESEAWVKDIIPIPLTTEIFEKNRWKKDDYDNYMITSYIYIRKGYSKYFHIYIGDEYITKVRYAHELNHILRPLRIIMVV